MGESKETTPRWIGFDGISGLFDEIKSKLKEMKQYY